MLNKSQFEVSPASRVRAGQTLTLEEYKALQAAGSEPDTLNGPDRGSYFWPDRANERQAGKAENRREAKEILGLKHNDTQYGPNED
jgi:hypothetical protein